MFDFWCAFSLSKWESYFHKQPEILNCFTYWSQWETNFSWFIYDKSMSLECCRVGEFGLVSHNLHLMPNFFIVYFKRLPEVILFWLFSMTFDNDFPCSSLKRSKYDSIKIYKSVVRYCSSIMVLIYQYIGLDIVSINICYVNWGNYL